MLGEGCSAVVEVSFLHTCISVHFILSNYGQRLDRFYAVCIFEIIHRAPRTCLPSLSPYPSGKNARLSSATASLPLRHTASRKHHGYKAVADHSFVGSHLFPAIRHSIRCWNTNISKRHTCEFIQYNH